MLKLITEAKKIEELHKELESKIIKKSIGKPQKIEFSSRGGNEKGLAYFFSYFDAEFWWVNNRKIKDYKLFNLFGINPKLTGANSIIIQINYQREFQDFSEAAIWAEDDFNNIYLLHSGKMGGGVSGISIESVSEQYNGERAQIKYGKKIKDYFIVCQLNSAQFLNQICNFILEVNEVKNFLKAKGDINSKHISDKDNDSFDLNPYTPEFWGKRKSYYPSKKIESNANHGIIVDALKNHLEKTIRNRRFVKNKYIDLGIVKDKKPHAIFEVKTSCNSQSIYTAFGQVTLHENSLKSKVLKFVVFPDDISKEVESDFNHFGIKTLRYKWVNDKVRFLNKNILEKC